MVNCFTKLIYHEKESILWSIGNRGIADAHCMWWKHSTGEANEPKGRNKAFKSIITVTTKL